MDPRHYGRIGTTARADPVNNQEILFPNGYDRNQNLGRPLVTVCDTAGVDVDDFSDEDFGFKSSSPSENVTVTIKFSSALDGIVTETDKRKSENFASSSLSSNHSQQDPDIVRGCSVEERMDAERTDSNDKIFKNVLATPDDKDTSLSHDQGNPDVIIIDESTEYNKRKENIQNNLYEEYERFVETPEKQDNIVRPKSINKTILPSEKQSSESVKPKVKIVYETNSPTSSCSSQHVDLIDRSEIVSPIFKTPIVKETSSTSGDEAEDFLEYLKQLKGKEETSVSDDSHSISNDECQCENRGGNMPDNNGRRKPIKSFKEELVPMLSVNATVVSTTNEETPIEVIVISDDEGDECEDKDKSLVEFDFGSLKRSKQATGGNGILNEAPESSSESDSNHDKVIPKGKRKIKKKLFKKVTESGCDTDSDSDGTNDDDSDDEDNEKSTDKKDDDDNDDDSEHNDDDGGDGNGGNSDIGSSENDNDNDNNSNNDENRDDLDHFNDEPEHGSDTSYSDGYENERYYSPGMRSRSTDNVYMVTSDNTSDSDLLGYPGCGNHTNIRKECYDGSALADSMEIDKDKQFQHQEQGVSNICKHEMSICNDIALNQNENKPGFLTLNDSNDDDSVVKEPYIADIHSDKEVIDSVMVSENDTINISVPDNNTNSTDMFLTETQTALDILATDSATIFTSTSCHSEDNTEKHSLKERANETFKENNEHDSVDMFFVLPETGVGDIVESGNIALSSETYYTGDNSKEDSTKGCEIETRAENVELDTVNVSSYCSDSLTAEDSEIIEILDYSETVNSLDCKFKTIDTYLIDEYESFSDGETSNNTSNISCNEDIFCEMVNDEPDMIGCLVERRNDNSLSITNLDSKGIIKSLIFNPGVSDDGSDCSMLEIDECVSETSEALPDYVTSLKDNCNIETEQTVKWDVSMFSDSSSSCSDDVSESEFESAIDEEFWNKTVGSASEMSFSDKFTSDESESENERKCISNISLETNNNQLSRIKSSEYSLHDKCNENFQSSRVVSHDSETESEYESIDLKSSNVENSDFVHKIVSRIPCSKDEFSDKIENIQDNITPVERSKDYVNYVKTQKPQVKSNGGLLAHGLRENAVLALKNRSCRTVSYFAPFLKDVPIKEVIPSKEKALRLICRQRKALLERVLPVESSGNITDKSNIATSNDSFDSENSLQCTISDLKRKSKLCNDTDQTQHIGKPGEIIKLGIGYYIFGAGDKLDLPIGPKLKADYDRNLDKDVCRPSIYFRGEINY